MTRLAVLVDVAWLGGELLENVALLIEDGQLRQVAPLSQTPAGWPTRDPRPCLVTRGLVNAHTHLNLSWLAGELAPQPFWSWLPQLVTRRRAALAEPGFAQDVQQSALAAMSDAQRQGVTTLVDMHADLALHALLGQANPGHVAAVELLSVTGADEAGWSSDVRSLREVGRPALWAPHAPYTALASALGHAAQAGPVTVHWAETSEELAWLEGGDEAPAARPLVSALRALGAPVAVPSPRQPAVGFAQAVGLLSPPCAALLVHGNALTTPDVNALADACAAARLAGGPVPAVCFCPRSHAFFGLGPHPWRDLLAAGVPVCLGTDSLASLPAGAGLSVLEEMRLLWRSAAPSDSSLIWRLGTARCDALRLADPAGATRADLLAWPLGPSADPLGAVLEGRQSPQRI